MAADQRFDLSTLVHHVLAASDQDEPTDLVREVFVRIPVSDHAEALRQALRPLIVKLITTRRSNVFDASSSDDELQDLLDGHLLRRNAQDTSTVQQPTSWKVSAIQSSEFRALRDRMCVNGAYKRLGACTADDLRMLASDRDKLAVANAHQADRFRYMEKSVRERRVATLADLPAVELVRLFGPPS